MSLKKKQKDWINHFSDTKSVKIVSYDASSEDKFRAVKKKLKKILGESVKIKHMGASGMKISGQNEIDVFIPVLKKEFNNNLKTLMKSIGRPKSLYVFERARFSLKEGGKKIDLFLINKILLKTC